MDRFEERLKPYKILGLDTSIFIYHFEAHPTYLPLTQALLSTIESGRHAGVTSGITLLEIIVKPLADGHHDIARKYETLISHFPNLNLINLGREVIRQAARLRAEYKIRTPDALQVAAGLTYGMEAFITNDVRLKRLKDTVDIIVLDDFI
jgi:predicted nucleic acid-binding protein